MSANGLTHKLTGPFPDDVERCLPPMGFSDRDSEMCTCAKLEEEGGPDSFHHLGDPTNQGQQGEGEVHCCLAWDVGAGSVTGARGLARDWSVLPSLHSSVFHPPSSTPNSTEGPVLGVGDVAVKLQTWCGERGLIGRQLMCDTRAPLRGG